MEKYKTKEWTVANLKIECKKLGFKYISNSCLINSINTLEKGNDELNTFDTQSSMETTTVKPRFSEQVGTEKLDSVKSNFVKLKINAKRWKIKKKLYLKKIAFAMSGFSVFSY